MGHPRIFKTRFGLFAAVLGICIVWTIVSPQSLSADTGVAVAATQIPATSVSRQQTPAPAVGVKGATYQLPFSWKGPDEINPDLLAKVAPPLEVMESSGSYTITHLAGKTGAVIRILATRGGSSPDAAAPTHSLTVAWRLTGTSTAPKLPAGSIVQLSVEARLYSPPNGVDLSVQDHAKTWGSSSVTMHDINWKPYTVTRQITNTADAVRFVIAWKPTLDNAWLEMRNLKVTWPVSNGAATLATLSPTDTPTPRATPTPKPAPKATAKPAPKATNAPKAGPAGVPQTPQPKGQKAAPTLTPLVVTSTPTPKDVFAAATRVIMVTDWARILGPATPTPPNLATPTPTFTLTPTPTPVIITNTPTPGSGETATYVALYATAQALTTGTPTPFPPKAMVLVATDTSTPKPKAGPQPRPTNTPTPLFIYFAELPPTPTPKPTEEFPSELVGKILFMADYFGPRRARAFMINPDGTGLAILTTNEFYTRCQRPRCLFGR